MIKKITLFTLGLLLSATLWAQMGNNELHGHSTKDGAKTITFPASDIQFWTGTGTNQAVVIVGWDDNTAGTNFALAWGVRWNGSATAQNMLDTIMAYDSRFSYSISGSFVSNVSYNDGTLISGSSNSYWCYNVNNTMAAAYPSQIMANGDVMEISSSCNFTLSSAVAATNPNPSTPESATIDASDIVYWVGEGSYEIIFAVNWPDTALAWGYRFSARSTNLQSVMNDIAAADPRLTFVTGSYGIDDILFVENGDTLRKASFSWWEHTLNGALSAGLYQQLNDGDFSRWADPSAGVVVDSTYDTNWNYWMYTYAYPQTIYPVSAPTPTDATISADDILYWVGEGENDVVFVVNWPDSALAWGYRFDGNATIQDAMDAIAAADSRFAYTTNDWGVDDIFFIENGDTLRKTAYSWWEHSLNGAMSSGMYQPLSDGDFSRWADPTAGVLVDSVYDSDWNYWMYSYVYPQRIYPVSQPDEPEVGPFCGAVGTEGCTAVKYDDSRIKGWATGCTVVRGSSNLLDPDAAPVTYGTENDAVGPATSSTMDVVSLGDGGSATLTFATPIANGDGYDFAVFENPFNDSFLELAVVEVSTDGEHFVRFPATSLTQTDYQITDNNGGVDPTFINNLAGKYRVGYGTPFDLEELRDSANIDINNINYVRVIDVVGSIDPQYGTYDAFGHLINDPFPTVTYSAGFDLDGVAVMNDAVGIREVQSTALSLYPNPANHSAVVSFEAQAQRTTAILYDMTGRAVVSIPVEAGATTITLNTATLANGVYMFHMAGNVEKLVIRH